MRPGVPRSRSQSSRLSSRRVHGATLARGTSCAPTGTGSWTSPTSSSNNCFSKVRAWPGQVSVHLAICHQAHVPDVLGGPTGTVPPHIAALIRAQHRGTRVPPPEHFHLPEPILGPIPEKVQEIGRAHV